MKVFISRLKLEDKPAAKNVRAPVIITECSERTDQIITGIAGLKISAQRMEAT